MTAQGRQLTFKLSCPVAFKVLGGLARRCRAAETRPRRRVVDPSCPDARELHQGRTEFTTPRSCLPPPSFLCFLLTYKARCTALPPDRFQPTFPRALLLPPCRLNATTMIPTATGRMRPLFLALFCAVMLLFSNTVEASVGDRLPAFRECVEVRVLRAGRRGILN